MNECLEKKTLPSSSSELSALLDFCAEIKQRLIEFTMRRYVDEIEYRLATDYENKKITDREITEVIDTCIHEKRHSNRETLIDRFVRRSNLSPRDAEIVLGWRDSIIGVFQLGERDGLVVNSVNLVDDLHYRLISNKNTKDISRILNSRAFLVSRIVPLFDAWMLSGCQIIYKPKEKKIAYESAAKIAQGSPALFFRNPNNLEKAIELEDKTHQHFLKEFGGAWIWGSPQEVEDRWRKFMLLRYQENPTKETLEEFVLPVEIREAETVGMISDPIHGIYFLRDFGIFLSALQEPEYVKEDKVKELMWEYLTASDLSPKIFQLAAKQRPKAFNNALAVLLNDPDFQWNRDGERLLRKYNPDFLEKPQFPGIIPLNNDLADGLRYVLERKTEKSFCGMKRDRKARRKTEKNARKRRHK